MTKPVILSEAKDLALAKESFGRSARSFAQDDNYAVGSL